MLDQVFENLQKATESSVRMQQEMMKKWVEGFPSAATTAPSPSDAMAQWRRQWEDAAAEAMKRQKELMDKNYEAGIKALEDLFAAGEARSPQEYQEKVMELYRKSFESLRELSEAQLSEVKAATERWSKLMQTPSSA